jgi:hypothetical protein
MSGRNLELPPISVLVPADAATQRHAVAVVFPSQTCTHGFSKLLKRVMDDYRPKLQSGNPAPIVEATDTSITPHALRLCCEYLEHYSVAQPIDDDDGDVPGPSIASVVERSQQDELTPAQQRRRDLTPTVLTTPLHKPIEQLLSAWENVFVSTRLLRHNGDAWEHQDVISVLHAAQFLEIPTLEALCSGWCGSQITKMCASTKNSFEAAEMIRKFFHIEKDWTPEEEECLRIENEWPEGEE